MSDLTTRAEQWLAANAQYPGAVVQPRADHLIRDLLALVRQTEHAIEEAVIRADTALERTIREQAAQLGLMQTPSGLCEVLGHVFTGTTPPGPWTRCSRCEAPYQREERG